MKQIYLKLKIQKWQTLLLLFVFVFAFTGKAQISGPFDGDDVDIYNTAIGDVTWEGVYDNDYIDDATIDIGDNSWGDAYDDALYVVFDYDSDVEMEYRYHFSETYGAVIVEVIVTNDDDNDLFLIGDEGNLGADEDTKWHYLNLDGPFYAIAGEGLQPANEDAGDPVTSFIWGDETLAGLVNTDDSYFEDEDDNYYFEMFDFEIGPNETQRFLFIGGLGNIDDNDSNRPDRAYAAVQLLTNTANWPEDFTSFLTEQEKAQVVNWNLDSEAVVATCPPDITTNAEAGLCAKYINFDAPSHNLGPNVTITYRLTGATTKTIVSNEYQDNSQANFNIGTTDVNVYVVQNEGDLTYECDFSVTVIDRDADWDIYFIDGDSDPHIWDMGSNGHLTVYPTDFLDLDSTIDDEKCIDALEFYFVDGDGDRYSDLDFYCEDTETHWSWDIVAVDQNGWEAWLYDAEIYIDDNAPTAICENDFTVYLDSDGLASIDEYDIDNGSWDDCGIDIMWINSGQTSYDCDDVGGSFTVELGVEDNYDGEGGQTDYCTTDVYIEDDYSPIIGTINDTTLYLSEFGGTASLAASVYDDVVDDACGINDSELSQTFFDCEDMGENTVTLWVEDNNGNSSEKEFTVEVRDTFAPEVSCTNVTVYLADEPEGTATIVAEGSVSPPEPVAVMEKSATETAPEPPTENNNVVDWVDDNTDCVEFTLSKDEFDCADICEGTGCTTVTLTVTDADGNTAECTPTITVVDSSAPHVFLTDITVSLDDGGDYELTFEAIDDESWDNCGIDSTKLSDTFFTCENLGTHTVTLTAWDESGNSTAVDCNVTIVDEVAPEVVCNELTVTLYNNGEYNLNEDDLAEIAAGTTDNCTPFDELEIDVSTKGFECIHVFNESIPVTVTVTDASGNSASCETYIVVVDDIAPVVACKDVDIYLDKNGSARIYPLLLNDGTAITPGYARTFNDLSGGSYDACGIDSAWVSQTTFGCGDVGEVEVALYMMDPSMNIDSCTSIVTVHDTMAPVIAPVADVELVLEPGVCESEIDYPAIVITDKCGAELELTAGLGADGMFPLGVTTETWVATDDAGNTASVSFNVILTSTNAEPTLDAINDVEAEEDTEPISVAISGISYGNDCETQSVDVKASSTNPDLVTDVEVVYTSGSETGEIVLTIAPDMSGVAEVTVTVEVSVSETVSETFMVTVTAVNDAPFVVAPIADQMVHASYILKVPVSPVMGDIFDDIDDDMLTFGIMAEGGETLPTWATLMGDTLVCTPTIADTGCVNIIVTAMDAGGLSVSDTFEVCVDGYPVSIGEFGIDQFEVQMYPNPTRGKVNMDISSGIYEVQLAVMDITGKVVLQKQYSASENITFDMSGKVSGMYFVKMNIDGNQIVKKLIVDRK